MKLCPLTKQRCNPNCAWWREGDEECAVAVLTMVAVSEYNDFIEEKELQENLHKADKKGLPN